MDDKIYLKLQDENGVELISSKEITRLIPKDSISIDDEKLRGLDSFIIDARRAKLELKLLNGNTNTNQQLKSILSDKSRLVADSVETEDKLAMIFSRQRVEEVYSDDVLFARNKNNQNSQTWITTNTGVLAVQSIEMFEMFYTAITRNTLNDRNNALLSAIREFDTTYMNIGFRHSYPSIIASFGRGLQIENDLDSDDSTSLTDLFVAYLNAIKSNLGTTIESLMNGAVASGTGLEGLFSQITITSSNRMKYSVDYLLKLAELVYTNRVSLGITVLMPDEQTYQFPNAPYIGAAIILSSLYKKEWYDTIKTEFFNGMQQQLYMENFFIESTIYSSSNIYVLPWSYVPFLQCEILVYRYVWNSASASFSNEMVNTFCRDIFNSKLLTCISTNANSMFFGKPQTATITADGKTESGIPLIQDWTQVLSNMFNPVYRYYTFGSDQTQYKFYMDNIDFNKINGTNSDNFFCLSQYQNNNFIYFDSIKCHEHLLTDSELAQGLIFSDNIPVYDEEAGDQTDNYGLYIYKDFFNKYYIKNKSALMKVYGSIYYRDKLIYRGIVDYNSVSIERSSISFDMLDSVGATIDNIGKLESFIEFSQFDDENNSNVANLKAGTNIGNFITQLIRAPFPYNHGMNNGSFEIGNNDGLTNKVLTEISAEDAFLAAVQCSKRILYVNENGAIDISPLAIGGLSTATIDGEITLDSVTQEIADKVFNIDKLKNLANYDSFTPSIVAFYMQIRSKYTVKRTLEIRNQVSEIKILDKIVLDNKTYIVMSKNLDPRKKLIRISIIGEG